ncbi:SMI1/KNR4 family protein [Nannocystis punicea]|uniref:SMI1/KNR4 family protein n=1 Tax=Nannocystis punicea TaxID=2995304 RepID=A0ABY7H8P2_9BACT|nr:SMI1/KNR4 family protein [Nannocystis poenicansa]WAS95633.1 SMI1/KNR4 family protein [Nannocystis poenicansa]
MRDLIQFLAAYQPKYAEIVRGYPESRIAQLEHALGRSVPNAYRDFLATAAANLGFRVDEVTFDLDEVIELAEFKRDTMPAHIYPIAVNDVQPMSDYYLDVSRAPRAGDGRVVSFPSGSLSFGQGRDEYSSLRDMLFATGFREVRMLTLPCRESVTWSSADFAEPRQAPRRGELDRILSQLGLGRLGVTSEANALHERGDCAAIVYELPESPAFMVFIAGEQPEAVGRVAEALCDGLRGHGKRRALPPP